MVKVAAPVESFVTVNDHAGATMTVTKAEAQKTYAAAVDEHRGKLPRAAVALYRLHPSGYYEMVARAIVGGGLDQSRAGRD